MTKTVDPRDEPHRSLVQRLTQPRVLGPLAALALAALSAFVIHSITGRVHLDDIRHAVETMPHRLMWLCAGLTLISYAGMAFYDVVASRRVAPGRVPTRVAMFAGATAFAVSNTMGFHVLVGGPVRYRIYAAFGLDVSDVGKIVGLAFSSLYLSIALIVGMTLVMDPHGVPLLNQVLPYANRAVGIILLVGLVGVLAWLWRSNRSMTLGKWHLPLPTGRAALVLLVVGVIDITAAAGSLYVLMPHHILPSFPVFVTLYLAAVMIGSASHVPGGLGVLEATVLLGLGAGTQPEALAALVIYRLIYYFVPLVIAAGALAAFEGIRAQDPILRFSRTTVRRLNPVAAPVLAGLVFVGGLVLMLSGSLPSEGSRMDALRDVVPLPFSEASHLLASLTGLFLLILARGLLKRIALARITATVLLVSGAAFSMLRGAHWEAALLLSGIAVLLIVFRGAFHRKGDWRDFRPSPSWLALLAMVLISLTLIGIIAFRNVDYRADLWWRFAWSGDAPRFLRATMGLAVVIAAIAADSLLNRPVQTRKGADAIPQSVRDILTSWPNTQAQIALLGDKRFLVDEAGTAFLMYAVSGRSWVSLGDPVGAPEAGRELVWKLAEMADRAGGRPVFYAVTSANFPLYLDLGLALLKTGELARVRLADFTLEGKARHDLRYGVHRAERDGLLFEVIPKADVPAVLPELKLVSDRWLAEKSGQEKGFSLGRFDPRYIAEFDCAVMRKDGAIVAFANLLRGPVGTEMSVDLMRYLPGVSNVLMDALFARIMLEAKAQGYMWFSLGAAPLSGLADHPLASTWNRFGTFIYRRGDEFYNFDGLRAFKEKFGPVWTPQYLAAPGGMQVPRALVDVASLISGGAVNLLKH
ncbi:bifunctional lysylphosphatidylglycerol flippase/synthetase MprF [Pseudoruegeria sp. SK021]|uniref:bifunctional lysylphosphatidylglycerol flippase/synthetase MprF n=1 Tax=Pseudoruegeria sp. SK021 TaxID=1933035 RepID=UPI000A23E3FD|nr:bifunctional lysylphosphatidylglycerol flippase/synthetase MprF [Pseudoruegeria sp. SK021]OSP56397.1 hypothetical protein BV911_00015 [Pseudoruegeria sp. SK021]